MNCIKHEVIQKDRIGCRIDKYIAEEMELFSRSQLKGRIEKILLNGVQTKLSKKLKTGDYLEIYYTDPPAMDLSAERINIDIIYEDEQAIVVNKAQGMVVHPGSGNFSGTLVNALLHHCQQLKNSFKDTVPRPGIVHRLDKDTSGIIIAAKNPQSLEYLANQFRAGRVKKIYIAIVTGRLPHISGKIETMITRDQVHRKRFMVSESKGKKALTNYKVIRENNNFSVVFLQPKTGRTHQLRVHMKHLGCPIVGDRVYNRKHNVRKYSLLLHAYRLSIKLPGPNKKKLFKTNIPERFIDFFMENRIELNSKIIEYECENLKM